MRDMSATFAPMNQTGPEAMRQAMAAYVRAIHQAYLDAALLLPPAEQARMPLMAAERLTVAAVGARVLHVIGTTEALPRPQGPEVEIVDDLPDTDMRWTVRFFDPVVLPELGLINESDGPDQEAVRRALGLRTVLYHLAVPPGASLTSHHAMHAGTGQIGRAHV